MILWNQNENTKNWKYNFFIHNINNIKNILFFFSILFSSISKLYKVIIIIIIMENRIIDMYLIHINVDN